jgi:hypothetical protein
MSEKCLKMTHFDIKFKQIQGFLTFLPTGFWRILFCRSARWKQNNYFLKQFERFLFLFQNFQDFLKTIQAFKAFQEFSWLLKTNFVARRDESKTIIFPKQFERFLFLFQNFQDFSRLLKDYSSLQGFARVFMTFKDEFCRSTRWKQNNYFFKTIWSLNYFYFFFKTFQDFFKTIQVFSRVFQDF